MARKNSTDYMREMRARLRAAGLVPAEVWVLPENTKVLKNIEKTLRQPLLNSQIDREDYMMETTRWTIAALHAAFSELDAVKNDQYSVDLVQGTEPTLLLTLHEFGDLPIYVAAIGEHIMVDTLLIDVADVKDVVAFNDVILRSREMFPLSSIGIETMPDGKLFYSMFGSLSAMSSLTTVVHEVHTLAENVSRAADAFSEFFN
ncbi:MAG: hypothetical protein JWP80_740 [Pseudomonas sp.]|nr:hypothetical protein [Pseudomonas sp.]